MEIVIGFDKDNSYEYPNMICYVKDNITRQLQRAMEVALPLDTRSYEGDVPFKTMLGDSLYSEKSFKEFFRVLQPAIKSSTSPLLSCVSYLTHNKTDNEKTNERTWIVHFVCAFTNQQQEERKARHQAILNCFVRHIEESLAHINPKDVKEGVLTHSTSFTYLFATMHQHLTVRMKQDDLVPHGIHDALKDYFRKKDNIVHTIRLRDNVFSFKVDLIPYFCIRMIAEKMRELRVTEPTAVAPVQYEHPLYKFHDVLAFSFHGKKPLTTDEALIKMQFVGNKAVEDIRLTDGVLFFTIHPQHIPQKRFLEEE